MSRRILVVDDEATLQMALTIAFEGAGDEVAVAASAEEAMERLRAGAFDAVLIDKNLPGKSGLDLVRWIRERNLTVALVVMTAYASAESATEALNLGIDRYLEKPFENLIAIPKMVDGVLEGGRAPWQPDDARATLVARGIAAAGRTSALRVVLACGAAVEAELAAPLTGSAPAGTAIERHETIDSVRAAFDRAPPAVDLVVVDADGFPKLVELVGSIRAKAQFVEIAVVVSNPLPLSQLQDLILAGVLQIIDRESGDTPSQLGRVVRGVR